MSDKKRRLVAYHEAGHALVGALMPEYDPVTKISIVPRGAAGGLTFFAPSEERLESGLYSRTYFENQVGLLLVLVSNAVVARNVVLLYANMYFDNQVGLLLRNRLHWSCCVVLVWWSAVFCCWAAAAAVRQPAASVKGCVLRSCVGICVCVQMAVALGGRIAEELIFGDDDITTGASNDFQQVSTCKRHTLGAKHSTARAQMAQAQAHDNTLGYMWKQTARLLEVPTPMKLAPM